MGPPLVMARVSSGVTDYSRSRLLDPVSNRCFAVLYFCAGISVALRRPETCRDG